MDNLKEIVFDKILPYVQKPGRYIGGELNAVVKDHARLSAKILIAFPDVYEIGMSHLGCKILYELVNGDERFCAERAFAPWPDMEKHMREHGVPLHSLETFAPAADFDIIGFSLQYELSYTNVLNMLDLGGVPIFARDRADGRWPFVIGGGPCAFNPEPVADFFDAFIIGEAEESLPQFMDLVSRKKGLSPRSEVLADAARTIKGFYVPSMYDLRTDAVPRRMAAGAPNGGVPYPVRKAVVEDLDAYPSPVRQIVPFVNIVHDRAALEIMRGCARGCRFCQAGTIYRPRRARDRARLVKDAAQLIRNTGYEEITLLSLSTGDYPEIEGLIDDLVAQFDEKKVSISIPSLRVDSFSVEIAKKIRQIKKTGFTFACEAGTERMLEVIRKEINFSELFAAVESAYAAGWKLIKLYFMIGLPGETDADLDRIADVIYAVSDIKRKIDGYPGQVNVSVSSFVPKPHTPFQWVAMNPPEEIARKQRILKKRIHSKKITLKFHEIEKNVIEAVFARGGRGLSLAVLEAWKAGARFDDWNEYFNFERWRQAFAKAGVDSAAHTGAIPVDAPLPWDVIDSGVSKEALKNEYRKALDVIANSSGA
ncbi:MAG TPA: TIGR03960 family B12-binding radical SAM protein [bacterium]|nr:TIGR03960 family B12-binding radical SAM protein [bacterium]